MTSTATGSPVLELIPPKTDEYNQQVKQAPPEMGAKPVNNAPDKSGPNAGLLNAKAP